MHPVPSKLLGEVRPSDLSHLTKISTHLSLLVVAVASSEVRSKFIFSSICVQIGEPQVFFTVNEH